MKRKISDCSRAEIEELLNQWVIFRRNAERNREIYKRAMFDGVSQEKIAEEFDLTPRQVQNAIYSVQKIVCKHMT